MFDLSDISQAAKFRGGKYLSHKMTKEDLGTKLYFECSQGYKFQQVQD
jgi:hypothetical protein